MTVQELIRKLSECNPDAEVVLEIDTEDGPANVSALLGEVFVDEVLLIPKIPSV